jgi:cell fate (sporulation/competence/biofilm development) regulator YlbF (YheA/YmcA/DUF963 family)
VFARFYVRPTANPAVLTSYITLCIENAMTLRNSLIAKIWSAIEKSPFTPADFDVHFGNDKSDLVSIEFRHRPEYRFCLEENYKHEFIVRTSPGEHKKDEAVRVENPSAVPDLIIAWSRNIRDELRTSIPVYSELEELREIIEKHVSEHIENPSDSFTETEANELRQKLDELLSKFEEMQQKSEITEQELNRLSQELTSIKANLNSYPKGVWYKTAANRIWSSVSGGVRISVCEAL